jgi:hypothetical protein
MKKKFLIILLFCISLSYAFIYRSENSGDNSIVLQFIARNGYGNNLYIDNVTVGTQYAHDIKITSFINMPSDTVYSNAPANLVIDSIVALVTNVGTQTVASSQYVLSIPEIRYSDTVTLPAFGPKIMAEIYFVGTSFAANTTYNPVLYLLDSLDGNRDNDTLRQSFGFYQGAPKKILFENFTSLTSTSAAVNNPPLNNFVNSKFDSIVAINYHLGFPAPGNDSLYLGDTIANKERAAYYNIVSLPNLIFSGSYFSNFPFSTENLQHSFDTLKNTGSPLTINVADTRLTGDTISADITVNIIAPVKAGNYFLRVNAVERMKTYANAPGSNGETVFYDIFREAVPNTQGTPIPTAPGSYNYNFKYVMDSAWADSMIYTVAFIQDDNTFEVLNSAKSRTGVFESLKNFRIDNAAQDFISEKFKRHAEKKYLQKTYSRSIRRSIHDTISTGFYLEQFETPGLPPDWTLAHLSELITFENVYNSGINGISYPGNGSMRMNFYSNADIGQMDTLYSPVISGVTSLDTLRFDYAYAGYLFNEGDSLTVNISTDGGLTFPRNIFYKGGLGLATSSSSTVSFVPTFASQWRRFSIPLQGIVPDNFSPVIVKDYVLNQNYPNPFNPVTKISFSIPVQSQTLLIIYDISGREIKRLVDEQLSAGIHEVNFNGEFLSSGVYFYKLITPGFTQSKKMVLIK